MCTLHAVFVIQSHCHFMCQWRCIFFLRPISPVRGGS
uniref:Uncharacterized protein n=1 Tax=Anguilla anguilla TaxID=7936 RepID=A0A0E9UYV4_ANGAN